MSPATMAYRPPVDSGYSGKVRYRYKVGSYRRSFLAGEDPELLNPEGAITRQQGGVICLNEAHLQTSNYEIALLYR